MGSQKEVSRRQFLSAAAGSTAASLLARPAFSLAHETFSNAGTLDVGSNAAAMLPWQDQGVINTANSPYAKLHSVPVHAVTIDEGFWSKRRATNVERSIPIMRQELEDQLRHSQKMEAVGRLAGGIAHDLNNALTAIAGYAELALGQVPDEHPVREDLDEIRRAAERASSVTRHMLEFSRKRVLEPRVFSLNEIVMAVARMLSRLLGSGIEVGTRLQPALPQIPSPPAGTDGPGRQNTRGGHRRSASAGNPGLADGYGDQRDRGQRHSRLH